MCVQGDRTVPAMDEDWGNHLGLIMRKGAFYQSQLRARASSLIVFEPVFCRDTSSRSLIKVTSTLSTIVHSWAGKERVLKHVF